MIRRSLKAVVAVFVVGFTDLAACGSSPADSTSFAGVSSITVTIDSSVLTVSHQARASAAVLEGGKLVARSVSWSSSNSQVALVSTSGVIVAVSVGTATITATAGGKSGAAPITVVGMAATALSGSVTDAQGRPVGGGTVEVLSPTNTAELAPVSAAGTWSAAAATPGVYSLRLHAPPSHSLGPGEPDQRTVTLTDGQRVTSSFVVQEALYTDDFQSYTTATLKGGYQQRPIPSSNFWAGANHDIGALANDAFITMDPTGGINGDKAMRYDWPAKPGASCQSEQTIAIMPRLNPPPTGLKTLWVRFTTKESAGFSHGLPGCTRSYKFFLVGFENATTNGRVGTYLFDGTGPAGPHIAARLYMDMNDNQGGRNAVPNSLAIGGEGPTGWGGSYHTWVIGLENFGTASATFTTYLDGQRVGTLSGEFLNGRTLGPGWNIMFQLGANINNGPDHAQSRWWREFGVYTTRPSLRPLVANP